LVGEHAHGAAQQLPGWDCESVGYVTEVETLARLHRAADIFLFASPAENFPCAVLEAMAAGSCVVATPTGGVVEQIEDGVSGILAQEVSGPALGQALLRALNNLSLSRSMGEAARARVVRDFNETLFLDRHRKVYAEILAAWHPNP
jgi:glycosyltransferase involved in cell wall biosynthesis